MALHAATQLGDLSSGSLPVPNPKKQLQLKAGRWKHILFRKMSRESQPLMQKGKTALCSSRTLEIQSLSPALLVTQAACACGYAGLRSLQGNQETKYGNGHNPYTPPYSSAPGTPAPGNGGGNAPGRGGAPFVFHVSACT